LTAIRQTAAANLKKSMEDLVLGITVSKSESGKAVSFPIIDIFVHGAKITAKGNTNGLPHLDTTNEMINQLELVYLTWYPKEDKPELPKNIPSVTLPVYRNSTRDDLLFSLDFIVIGNRNLYYERGVALVAGN